MPILTTPATPDRAPTSLSTDCIDQYAIDRARYRVDRLQRAFGLNEHDAEDAFQDMLIELWIASPRYNGSRGSRRTFVCGVLDRCYHELARKLRRRGRRAALTPMSLESVFGPRWFDTALPSAGASAADRTNLRIDLDEALAPLPRRERLVAEDLKHFGNVADVAKSRSMHRGTAYRAVGVIRERLLESGIDE